jgi:hypothetical protein
MRFDDVWSYFAHDRTDLVEPKKPVIARVVGMSGPCNANDPSTGGDGSAAPGIFISRARRDDRVLVAELAQNVTSGR